VIDNLCLLCRYHHGQVHLEQLSLEDLEIRPLVGASRDEVPRGVAPPFQ
jgi:hypothetical protein